MVPDGSKPPFKKFLVISHQASLTGAPFLLLNLMRLLREKEYTFNTLIRDRGGPLQTSFEELSEVCEVFNGVEKEGVLKKLKRKLLGKKREFNVRPLLKDVDCVISNTITNGALLDLIRKHFKGPIISYVHELETVTILSTTKQSVQSVLQLTNHFIVPCNALKNFLLHQCKIQNKNISLLNYYIPQAASHINQDLVKKDKAVQGSFIVGSLGIPDWRKGMDIFILVASVIFQRVPEADIQFVWMGGKKNSIEHIKMLHDIDRLKLNNKVLLFAHSSEADLFLKSIDLLLLPSREDPYPLVVLEAARERVPTICFNNAGGVPEFMENDAGTVVDYLDIFSMADRIYNYYTDKKLLHLHGLQAYNKVSARHQDKALIVDQFTKVLDFLL
jgi:glycosyltransferase involved in cell wall biosynthesis